MANKVQLKAAGDQAFKANDPFAELTRIMGFDPRVQPTPRPDEDFEIDLEKELMGMFDPGPDAPAGPSSGSDYPQESASRAPTADEIDEAFAASLEEELSGPADVWEPIRDVDAEAGPVGEGLADVDMDFGAPPPRDWREPAGDAGEAAMSAERHGAEREDLEPSAGGHDGRNVYRPSFFTSGYAAHAATEAAAPAKDAGPVEAPVFDIRSFKSAAQQYREAAPRRETAASGEGEAETPVEARPSSRTKAVDPFDILAALGTERGLPQRRDPFKANAAEPPAAPEVDDPSEAGAEESQLPASAYPEEEPLPSSAAQEKQDVGAVEEGASGPEENEMPPFLNIRPAAPSEPAQQIFAAADIDRMAEAMHAYMAPVPGAGEAPRMETAQEAGATPEIETTEVFEPAVALADDLDIPVPAFLTEARPAPVYDELDEEFEHAFQTLSQHTDAIRKVAEEEWVRPAAAATDIERLFAEELGIGGGKAPEEPPTARAGAAEGFAAADMRGANAEDELVFDDRDFFPDEFATAAADGGEDAFAPAAPAYAPRRISQRRGRLLAGVAVGVLLIGGIGAFALSRGGGDKSEQPVVLKADARPVKVKPKNPGGVAVPNQDNKVYERVEDGAKAVAPEQKKLVSTEEQPVDIAARAKDAATALPGVFQDDQIGVAKPDPSAGGRADDSTAPAPDSGKASAAAAARSVAVKSAPSQDIADLIKAAPAEPAAMPKGEDRLAPTRDASPKRADSDILAVTPRKVKTMIVRADGTMVPREDPAPAEAEPATPPQAVSEAKPAAAPAPAQEPQAKAVAPQPAAPNDEAMATMAKADVKPAEAPKPVQAARAKPIERLDQGQISTPERVAIAPSRPADQPLDIVGEAPRKAASADPAPAPAASGDWAVQIASQPTAEAAQTTYQNMARRYASVLGGYAANIVKADIAGKGTYYRVRIAAGSRDDAIALCTRYKAAGGSCFVSK
jgi:hypothetical protein